jgi:hypothetical protein
MRVDCFLQTRVSLYSRSRNYYLGKGVKLYTDEVCDALLLFLFYEHEKNPSCLFGDIASLYKRQKEILQKRLSDNTTYQEHLQKQIRKGVYSS